MNPRYEFRFLTIKASHMDGHANPNTDRSDLDLLQKLGQEGWHVTGILPDPMQPAAKLIVSLQREVV